MTPRFALCALALLASCGDSGPPPQQIALERGGPTFAFARTPALSLTLPERSRPDLAQLQDPSRGLDARTLQRELTLNRASAGLADDAFVHRSLRVGEITRQGLLLPAPASAEWSLAVPARGVLAMEASILPPRLAADGASDGARLIVEVSPAGAEDAREPAGSVDLSVGDWAEVRLDLSRWAGQTVRLRFRTDPGESALLDYVFLSDPMLYTPTTAPRRLVLVFIDTLRVDHLGLYGYERDTTPRIDAWSQGAAVFTHARAVAPWTLPSTRALLSSRQPESWRDGPILPELLAQQGWATAAFIGGNPYLTGAFGMSEGWGRYDHPDSAEGADRVAAARAFLEANPDRDAAVLLHVMDMHLPYSEPEDYRALWAGDPPPEMPRRPVRASVEIALASGADPAAFAHYLQARYDQNLRYLDDAIGALLESLGPTATVVLFSDHGEEFWDHGGFEHGNTLYEELLRVPLVIKGPGVPARRVEAPVSLMDLAPTLAELLDLDPQDMHGTSLIPAASGDGAAIKALKARDLAFGNPLYGSPRWGVLAGDLKWTSHGGAERVFNLATDPGERGAIDLDPAPLRAAFAAAIGRPAPVVWRVELGTSGRRPLRATTLSFRHPGGFAAAWLGESPWDKTDMSLAREGDTVRVTLGSGAKHAREIYLEPAGDPAQVEGLELRADGVLLRAGPAPAPDGTRRVLLRGRVAERDVTITYGVAPRPPEQAAGLEIPTVDPELTEALKALGYTDPESP